MAIYGERDIRTDLSGDLVVSSKGDLEIASSTRTSLEHVMWRLRTAPEDFTATDTKIGANLGSFIGENVNESLLIEMEDQIRSSLQDRLLDPQDLFVTVVPISCDEVLVYTKVEGLFITPDGLSESEGYESVFSLPMYEGDAIQLISYQNRT